MLLVPWTVLKMPVLRRGRGQNMVGSDIQFIVIPNISMSVSVQKSSVLKTDMERLGTTTD